MTLATLADLLGPAQAGGYAVAGLVCLGWEDARACVEAAEAEEAPAILMVGPGARAHMPLAVWAPLLRGLAEGAGVPLAVHLDHGRTQEECRAALDLGFTSVMLDGSGWPLARNIEETAAVAALARAAGASCEGEVGVVAYPGGISVATDPGEAARFERETGVDATAVSAGSVHLQPTGAAPLDEERLAALARATRGPLVIHGGSGLPRDQRARLGRSRVAKVNVGTELRRAFGAALRAAVLADPERFDRLALLRETHDPVVAAARAVIASLGGSGRAAA